MMKKLCSLLAFLGSLNTYAGNVNVYSYSAGSVSTSAYTVLWKSTPVSASHLEICDTSSHILKIATGASSHEVDVVSTTVSGCVVVQIYIPAGTQLSIIAIDATASTGYNVVSIQ